MKPISAPRCFGSAAMVSKVSPAARNVNWDEVAAILIGHLVQQAVRLCRGSGTESA
jgi:hypothetical protein